MKHPALFICLCLLLAVTGCGGKNVCDLPLPSMPTKTVTEFQVSAPPSVPDSRAEVSSHILDPARDESQWEVCSLTTFDYQCYLNELSPEQRQFQLARTTVPENTKEITRQQLTVIYGVTLPAEYAVPDYTCLYGEPYTLTHYPVKLMLSTGDVDTFLAKLDSKYTQETHLGFNHTDSLDWWDLEESRVDKIVRRYYPVTLPDGTVCKCLHTDSIYVMEPDPGTGTTVVYMED